MEHSRPENKQGVNSAAVETGKSLTREKMLSSEVRVNSSGIQRIHKHVLIMTIYCMTVCPGTFDNFKKAANVIL